MFEISLKGKKRSGVLLWQRQKNNEVKLEQHHIIALVESEQRQSTIASLGVEKKEKGLSVTGTMKFWLVGLLLESCFQFVWCCHSGQFGHSWFRSQG